MTNSSPTLSAPPQPTHSPLPLAPASIRSAHALISPYIHRTPLLTNATLNRLASTPLADEDAAPQLNLYFKCENLQKIGAFKARGAHHALLRLQQRMGADELRRRGGVITHSSGNHAQALALAAKTLDVPVCIVMPEISTPSKIAGTRLYTDNVVFSGSTSDEREEVVAKIMAETGAILIPPYDHVDIVLGQGTVGLEMEEQFERMKDQEEKQIRAAAVERREEAKQERIKVKEAKNKADFEKGMDGWFGEWMKGVIIAPTHDSTQHSNDAAKTVDTSLEAHQNITTTTTTAATTTGKTRAVCSEAINTHQSTTSSSAPKHTFDAVIAPLGGGGLLGGITTYFSPSTASTSSSPSSTSLPRKYPRIYGAEPSHQNANDAELGLATQPHPTRIPHVKSLTIADGLRTPVGLLNWDIISDPATRLNGGGVYSVSDEEIKAALRLVLERMKVVVEPSACVGLAVVLFNRRWRKEVAQLQRREWEKEGNGNSGNSNKRKWDVGVVFSGGNTTVDAIAALFGPAASASEDPGVEKGGEEE